MSENKDKAEDLGQPTEVFEELGHDFEVLEAVPAAGSPVEAAAPAPAPQAAQAGAAPPVRSTAAWTGMGLAVALAGLLGGWSGEAEASLALLRGLMIASIAAHLLTRGVAAVQPTSGAVKPVLPGLLLLTGIGGVRLGGGGFAIGPRFTAPGGPPALRPP
ncbi:MAG: hypothetical protein H8E31_02045, partial [Planctomycetes bacterium]|nr:hypothetical protein [Planctomycetota bacterium]